MAGSVSQPYYPQPPPNAAPASTLPGANERPVDPRLQWQMAEQARQAEVAQAARERETARQRQTQQDWQAGQDADYARRRGEGDRAMQTQREGTSQALARDDAERARQRQLALDQQERNREDAARGDASNRAITEADYRRRQDEGARVMASNPQPPPTYQMASAPYEPRGASSSMMPQAESRPSLDALIAAADRISGPEPAAYVPPDANAANAAGFARAKDQIGQVGRASLNTLRNVASARGISGSRYEGGQMARLVENTQGELANTIRDQAGKNYDVNDDAAKTNWQAQQDRSARRRASLAMLSELRPGGLY